VEGGWEPGAAPRADAMVTSRPGIALGILTADCAPVLFADTQNRVVGAAHAGWRGAVGGVLAAAVAAMERLGADRRSIHAAVGPTIAQSSYEVGPEFPAPFLGEDAGNRRFFRPSRRAGHHMFDLTGYVASRLEALDLAEIAVLGRDTCADEEQFFSYRRATLRHEPDYGRELSAIVIEP
jgi:purine-nucleoside/S-methyl-5'-thioadenosine phosphorylase / adenosine deaminase